MPKECEGMNPHTPEWIPCWELESQMDSRIFRARLQGSKPIVSKSYSYHWKNIETWMFKMGLHRPFGHMKHKLWPKERLGVKLVVWLLTTKSRELIKFHGMQVACDIPLESSWQGLQISYSIHCNWRSSLQVMRPQSCKSPICGNFGTHTWESQDKKPFGCGPRGELQSIL